ncbi:hypothetical protein KEM48_013066 [Puccinia striiformis f. sp. tritici PST-130]|nr:hypothetical protein KEM48_013066 [Puccinia striiformis f. sp. tritici PST-130]
MGQIHTCRTKFKHMSPLIGKELPHLDRIVNQKSSDPILISKHENFSTLVKNRGLIPEDVRYGKYCEDTLHKVGMFFTDRYLLNDRLESKEGRIIAMDPTFSALSEADKTRYIFDILKPELIWLIMVTQYLKDRREELMSELGGSSREELEKDELMNQKILEEAKKLAHLDICEVDLVDKVISFQTQNLSSNLPTPTPSASSSIDFAKDGQDDSNPAQLHWKIAPGPLRAMMCHSDPVSPYSRPVKASWMILQLQISNEVPGNGALAQLARPCQTDAMKQKSDHSLARRGDLTIHQPTTTAHLDPRISIFKRKTLEFNSIWGVFKLHSKFISLSTSLFARIHPMNHPQNISSSFTLFWTSLNVIWPYSKFPKPSKPSRHVIVGVSKPVSSGHILCGEAAGCISDVVQDRSVNFRKSTTQLTGFWSVSYAEALMWLGEKILGRKETKVVGRYKTIINTYNTYYLSKCGLGLKLDSGKFQKLLHKVAIDYQPAPQTLYEITNTMLIPD